LLLLKFSLVKEAEVVALLLILSSGDDEKTLSFLEMVNGNELTAVVVESVADRNLDEEVTDGEKGVNEVLLVDRFELPQVLVLDATSVELLTPNREGEEVGKDVELDDVELPKLDEDNTEGPKRLAVDAALGQSELPKG